MITEDYCSKKVSELLKEKGFNEECHSVHEYNNNPDIKNIYSYQFNVTIDKIDEKDLLRPTHQMAMAWLREVHNIVISIYPTIETDMIVREDYNYAIYKNKTVVYQSCSTSYEEAVEAALKYTLENVII